MPARIFARLRRPSLVAFLLSLTAAAAAAAPVDFDQPALPLGQAIQQLAHASGLTIGVDSALVMGKTAPALKGRLEPAEALRQLLAGSGLTATITGNDAVVTAQGGPVEVGPINVTAPVNLTPDQQLQQEGTADQGYLTQTTRAAGPIFGDLKLQDAPYTISEIPSSLIDNSQATSTEDLAKFLPQISAVGPLENQSGTSTFLIRGQSIEVGNPNGTAFSGGTIDGLMGDGDTRTQGLEDKERVELFTGADAYMLGIGSAIGDINYVLKRPTADPIADITVGSNTGAGGEYIHGDFGGPLNDKVSYRLNLVDSQGDTGVVNQSVDRYLVSGAIDLHMTDDWLVQLNASFADYQVHGTTPSLFTTVGTKVINIPTADQLPAAPWTSYDNQTTEAGFRTTYKLFDGLSARAAYDYTYDDSLPWNTTYYEPSDTNGDGAEHFSNGSSARRYSNSFYGFLDDDLAFRDIKNKLTVGITGDYSANYTGIGYYTYTPNSYACNIYQENCNLSQPSTKYNVPTWVLSYQYVRNVVLADKISYGPLSLIGGVTNTMIDSDSWSVVTNSKTGGTTYKANTPTGSLIYKVTPWLTAYGTYLESLQPGTVVPATNGGLPVTNSGALLPPHVGNDLEGGVKATVPGLDNLLVTFDYFQNHEAYSYAALGNGDTTYTYVESGVLTTSGLELMATGKVTKDITVIGGITELLKEKVSDDTVNPAMDGTVPNDVPGFVAKLYAEWNQPWLPGLTLLGDVNLFSRFVGPDDYTGSAAGVNEGYVVADLGLRYQTVLYGTPTIWRFNVNNVFNKTYINEYGNNGVEGILGAPRTFMGTVTVKF